MIGTIATQTITFFRTEDKARALANRIADDDPEWSYQVERWDRGFVVKVSDGHGFMLGTL